VVGRPSRVTYVPSTDNLIVTDDLARRLRVLSTSLWTQEDAGPIFPPVTDTGALLQFPSGHSMSADGRLAVIDFQTKSVVVWNTLKRRSGTGPEDASVMVCPTGLQCPGNVAVTAGGQLAVTDSRVRPNFSFR